MRWLLAVPIAALIVLGGVNSVSAARAGQPQRDISSAVHSYATTPEELRVEGIYQVLSPDQVVERVNEAGDGAFVNLHPLVGGMPIDEGWSSLRLYVEEVLPALG